MLLSFKCKRPDIAIFPSFWMGAFAENYFSIFLNFEKNKILSNSFYNNLETIDLSVTQKLRIILLWILKLNTERNFDSQKTLAVGTVDRFCIWKIVILLPFFCLSTDICILYTKIFILICSLKVSKNLTHSQKQSLFISSLHWCSPNHILLYLQID